MENRDNVKEKENDNLIADLIEDKKTTRSSIKSSY